MPFHSANHGNNNKNMLVYNKALIRSIDSAKAAAATEFNESKSIDRKSSLNIQIIMNIREKER